jgi:hypothetical protein
MEKFPIGGNLEDQSHNTKTHLKETVYEPIIKVYDNGVLDLGYLFLKFQVMDKSRKLLIYGMNFQLACIGPSAGTLLYEVSHLTRPGTLRSESLFGQWKVLTPIGTCLNSTK